MSDEPVTSGNIRLLWRWDTVWPADTVEFCPLPPYRHLLICGTYKLVEGQAEDVAPEDCQRDGQLHLLDPFEQNILQSLPTAAILDIKWLPERLNGQILFAAVDAKGRVLVYRLLENEVTRPKIELLTARQVGGVGRLALALDWSAADGQTRLAVSDSSGAVTVLQLQEKELDFVWSASCHGHEAWTCGFNYWNSHLIYTGGDDLLLRCYDVRQEPAMPVFTNRTHEAGVTSLQSDPLLEHVLRTGSYDEHVYTWDTRAMRRPVDRTALHGGVWRIKRHPRSADHVLTACMYGGSHVVGADGSTVASFMEHDSITYGADWCRMVEVGERLNECKEKGESDEKEFADLAEYGSQKKVQEMLEPNVSSESSNLKNTLGVAATCSFYDHLLCLWELFEME